MRDEVWRGKSCEEVEELLRLLDLDLDLEFLFSTRSM
jgi:hypothetical protein